MLKDSHFLIGFFLLAGLFLLAVLGGLAALFFLAPWDGPSGGWGPEGDEYGWEDEWETGWDDGWEDEWSEPSGDVTMGSAEDYLLECRPFSGERRMADNIAITVLYRIEGVKDGYCTVYEKVLSDDEGMGLTGKDMSCRIPMDGVSDLSLDGMECTGSLSEALDEIVGGDAE